MFCRFQSAGLIIILLCIILLFSIMLYKRLLKNSHHDTHTTKGFSPSDLPFLLTSVHGHLRQIGGMLVSVRANQKDNKKTRFVFTNSENNDRYTNKLWPERSRSPSVTLTDQWLPINYEYSNRSLHQCIGVLHTHLVSILYHWNHTVTYNIKTNICLIRYCTSNI